MNCAGCLKKTAAVNIMKCTSSSCDKVFCALCINQSSLTGDRKKTWKCPDCTATQKKGGDNSSTPIRHTPEVQNVTFRKKSDSAAESPEAEFKKLTAAITRLTTEFSTLTTRLEDVTHSLNYCHERMDELVRNITATDARLKNLEKRDQEIVVLQATVAGLQQELNIQAQHNLRNEIEIIGIPENSNENIEHIVKIATQKIGAQVEDADIDWITRVGPRRPVTSVTSSQSGIMPRPVVVRLIRRVKRDQILRSAKSRRNLSSTDLNIDGPPVKVFFNERLTKENRQLFRETRIRAKNQGYAYCWCSQGAIYIRQREGKPAQLIRTSLDLDRALPPTQVKSTS